MFRFRNRIFMSLILLLLVIMPVAINVAQDRASMGPAPTTLSPDTTTLTTAPVIPDFEWNNDSSAVEYRVFVRNSAEATILDENVDKGMNCLTEGATDLCGFSSDQALPGWGLVNNDYEWWVGAKYPDDTWAWSNMATFTVDVPAAALPTNITVYEFERPWIQLDEDPNTFWVEIWIGPHPDGNYLQWHSLAASAGVSCSGTCLIPALPFDRVSKNAEGSPYDLTVWMRAWGPGGFSTGGTEFDQWNQLSMVSDMPGTTFQLPQDPAPNPTNIVHDSGTGDLTWDSGFAASWHNLQAYDSATGAKVGDGWHLGSTIGCPGFALLTADYSCVVNLPDWLAENVTESAGSYDIRIRSWGPGGMSDLVDAVTTS